MVAWHTVALRFVGCCFLNGRYNKAMKKQQREVNVNGICNRKNKKRTERKEKTYAEGICPVCGNIIASAGFGSFTCCGIVLPEQEAEQPE